MSRKLGSPGFLVLVAALVLAGRAPAVENALQPALDGGLSWLALVDDGKYPESWRQASELFRRQITAEQWESAVKSAREPLGKLGSRRLSHSEETRSLPGAPDGDYVVMQYDASFENKKSAVETLILTKEKSGEWRAAGYFIK